VKLYRVFPLTGAIGYTLDLQLPDETLLTRLLRLPESVLPGNHHSWVNVFATFMARCKHHTSLLLPDQAEELIERFTQCPEKLQPDEMALVLAMLALGRQAETYLQGAEGEELFDEVTFYRLALGALDRCEQASPTALRKCYLAGTELIEQEHCIYCTCLHYLLVVLSRSSIFYQ
jgi:hypothetical protein